MQKKVKNLIFKGIWISFVFISVFLFGIKALALTDNDERENNIYDINDNFLDDSIIITLTEEESKKHKEYSLKDFEEVDAISIKELTENTYYLYKNDDEYRCKVKSFKRSFCIKLKNANKENVLQNIMSLNQRKDILAAEPDYIFEHLTTTPNDSYITDQWAINNISLKQAWDFETGTSNIRIGVIDTGIDHNHMDLNDNVNEILSDSFEFDDPWFGGNYHGTHVAGIIGAEGNNGTGICGVNWNTELVSYKIGDFTLSSSAVVSAISSATGNIPILNMSIGTSDYLYCLENAISNYDGLIICAAGNTGQNIDVIPYYPASFNYNNIITVGAISFGNARCSFSNYGENAVDIYAPGSSILSTFPTSICLLHNYVFDDGTYLCELSNDLIDFFEYYSNEYSWSYIEEHMSEIMYYLTEDSSLTPRDLTTSVHKSSGYHKMDGTSMAAPYVSGVAALLLSVDPTLTVSEMRNAILYGSTAISISVPDPVLGTTTQNVVKLDAYKAVKYVLTNISYQTAYLTNTSNLNYLPKTVLANNDYFVNDNAFYRLNVMNSMTYYFGITSNDDIIVELYDGGLNQLTYSSTQIAGGVRISKLLGFGVYYLRVRYQNPSSYGTISIYVSNDNHTHSYSPSFVWYNYTQHRKSCTCGAFVGKPHMINGNNYDPFTGYPLCTVCNGPVNLGTKNGLKFIITENGSYVTETGVIVLMGDDFELFINGQLSIDNILNKYNHDDKCMECSFNKVGE